MQARTIVGRAPLLLITALLLAAACAAPNPSGSRPIEPVGGTAASPSALAPGSASPGVGASPSSSQSFTVNMVAGERFDPVSLTVPRGATVVWHNVSQEPHTTTDDPSKAQQSADAMLPAGAQPWDSGTITPGQNFSHTFETPGTYQYFCIPHESLGMRGTIVVQP